MLPLIPLLHRNSVKFVIGCDEVGRGCLAGPVVAASVCFEVNNEYRTMNKEWVNEIKDSKLLSSKKREHLSQTIKENCLAWSIAEVDNKTIDEINIHNASLLVMQKAVAELHTKLKIENLNDTLLLLDGRFKLPNYIHEQMAVVDGDAKIVSIAAASIIAKVYRDELMVQLDKRFPTYGFAKHKGYGTKEHKEAIAENGITALHRKSFNL